MRQLLPAPTGARSIGAMVAKHFAPMRELPLSVQSDTLRAEGRVAV